MIFSASDAQNLKRREQQDEIEFEGPSRTTHAWVVRHNPKPRSFCHPFLPSRGFEAHNLNSGSLNRGMCAKVAAQPVGRVTSGWVNRNWDEPRSNQRLWKTGTRPSDKSQSELKDMEVRRTLEGIDEKSTTIS
ncbi:hypothetical protein B0H11DRAFT_1942816 [Mycena galericulata]|nr:hypothetical protein B0H11DRAFT_1942816 [Mycena galericulata]